MKLSKNEILAIQALLEPLYSNIINTKQASTELLGGSHLAQYRFDGEPEIPLEDLVSLATDIANTPEQDVLQFIHLLKDRKLPYNLASLALIKSGIRIGLQDNTHLLLDNISFPKNYQPSDKIIAALVKEL